MNRADGSGAARRRDRAHIFTTVRTCRVVEIATRWHVATARSAKVRADIPIPAAPYLDRRVREVPNLPEIWSYINPYMLYGRHLGFKGNFEKLLAERDPKALELYQRRREGEARSREVHEGPRGVAILRSRARRQFDPSVRAGRTDPLHTFQFGRQPKADGLCLSDYILRRGRRPARSPGDVRGHRGRRRARAFRRSRSSAANFCWRTRCRRWRSRRRKPAPKWLHRRIREDWGFPDPPTMTMQERFTSRYRGKRYSFGYPACPNLEDQQGLFELLKPEEIGVKLTEGFMMDPEASVSALVFHHPDCAYFTASDAA